MIYRFIYKITCTNGSLKGKFYYGQHTTEKIDDGYKGSGKILRDYYKKHKNDYIREIIAYYNTKEELNDAEKEIINLHINDDDCINIALGGKGGNICNYHKVSEETRKKLSDIKKGHIVSEETKNKISKANKGNVYRGYGWHQSEETKKKIGELAKQRVHPPRTEETKNKLSNTFKNYVHIHNGEKNKFVSKDKLDEYLNNGYVLGFITKRTILNKIYNNSND